MKIRNKHKFKHTIHAGNFTLKEICNATKPNLIEINQLIYAAARLLQSKSEINQEKKRRLPNNKPR